MSTCTWFPFIRLFIISFDIIFFCMRSSTHLLCYCHYCDHLIGESLAIEGVFNPKFYGSLSSNSFIHSSAYSFYLLEFRTFTPNCYHIYFVLGRPWNLYSNKLEFLLRVSVVAMNTCASMRLCAYLNTFACGCSRSVFLPLFSNQILLWFFHDSSLLSISLFLFLRPLAPSDTVVYFFTIFTKFTSSRFYSFPSVLCIIHVPTSVTPRGVG